MQKKIIASIIALCFVSVASIASADGGYYSPAPLVDVDVEVKIKDFQEDNDGIILNGNAGKKNIFQVSDIDFHFNDSYGSSYEGWSDKGATGSYYMAVGNVANQTNVGGTVKGDLNTSAVGNLVIHDLSRTITKAPRRGHGHGNK